MLITFHTARNRNQCYQHFYTLQDVSNFKAFMTSTSCSMKKFDLKLAMLGGVDATEST